MFEWIEGHKDLGQVDVCVPNAGFSHPGSLMVNYVVVKYLVHSQNYFLTFSYVVSMLFS